MEAELATLAASGGSFLGQVNRADIYVRIAPHEERRFSIMRLVRATLAGDPARRSAGTRTQRDVMNELRRTLSKLQGPADLDPELPGVQHRRRQLRDRLLHPRARHERARQVHERPARALGVARHRRRRRLHCLTPPTGRCSTACAAVRCATMHMAAAGKMLPRGMGKKRITERISNSTASRRSEKALTSQLSRGFSTRSIRFSTGAVRRTTEARSARAIDLTAIAFGSQGVRRPYNN